MAAAWQRSAIWKVRARPRKPSSRSVTCVTNRTRQAAARASEAADSDEPDPLSSKRSNGKCEGKKSGRSKVVVAETTRCQETYAVGIAAVLQAGDVTSW
jgi:hypothetical protein